MYLTSKDWKYFDTQLSFMVFPKNLSWKTANCKITIYGDNQSKHLI